MDKATRHLTLILSLLLLLEGYRETAVWGKISPADIPLVVTKKTSFVQIASLEGPACRIRPRRDPLVGSGALGLTIHPTEMGMTSMPFRAGTTSMPLRFHPPILPSEGPAGRVQRIRFDNPSHEGGHDNYAPPSGPDKGAPPTHSLEGRAQQRTQLEGPRDVLAAFGITESFLERVDDGQPVQQEEMELLLRLVFYSYIFQPSEISDWAESPPNWSAVSDNLNAIRCKMFRVPGYVKRVTTEAIPPELSSRLGRKTYYLCEVAGDDGITYLVYARRVPRGWKLNDLIHEKTTVNGLFVKLTSMDPADPRPVLVTDRPAWFPDNLLGRLGMDCALFDDIDLTGITERFLVPSPSAEEDEEDPLNRLRLTGRDRECFYQLMAAVERSKPGELFEVAKNELAQQQRVASSVVPLFNDPASQQGKLVLLYGTARRIEEITVENPEIRKRLGVHKYYTVYLFTEDSQNYPVVFCVRHLPDGVLPGEGPRYAVDLAIAGFFYKTWAFRPQRNLSPDAPAHAWQLAPLLIGREAIRVTSRVAQDTRMVTVALFAAVLALVGTVVVVTLWFTWREKRRPPLAIRQALSGRKEEQASGLGTGETSSETASDDKQ